MKTIKSKHKIINDPVHGFITVPSDFLYDIVQHPFFQRLGRIKQLGLTHVVYPGALHTRFQHSLGAMHLMDEALSSLRSKGIEITDAEAHGTLLAILLHDLGHAPFSHVLEHALANNISHEEISLAMMEHINSDTRGKLKTAISIFKNSYKKKFLHQLVSSQLDMDRLDYLMRDCFFTGVVEGAVGTDRIIKMLSVLDDELVVEAKGIYSIEKFLVARRIMYWQVYYHKTAVAAEQMLLRILKRAKELSLSGDELFASPALSYFLKNDISGSEFFDRSSVALENYVMLDDSDVISAIKAWTCHRDPVLSVLSKALINRRLFKVEVSNRPKSADDIAAYKKMCAQALGIDESVTDYFFAELPVSANTYSNSHSRINVLYADGSLKDIAEASDILDISLLSKAEKKYFFCYFRQ